MTPDDRQYTQSHEWVRVEGEEALVGITDHAQDALGDITFVELPEPGQTFEQGEECGVIESVKAASDLFMPIGGQVTEVNRHLEDEPEIINRDPYDDGWIFKIKGIDADEAEALMDAQQYGERLDRDEA